MVAVGGGRPAVTVVPPRRVMLVGELERPDRAGQLERVLDPAAGGAPDLLGAVRVLGVEGGGGAELAREGQLVVGEVDGDDLARARGDGAQQRAQADAAQPDHRHRAPAWTRAVLTTAPTPVSTAQPNKAASVERQLRVDLHQRAPRDGGVVGEARDAQVVLHRRAVGPVQPPRARRAASPRRSTAAPGSHKRRPALGARAAMAAGRDEDAHHVVAAGEVVDPGPDLLDDAGRLVARAPSASAAAGRR